MSFGKTLNLLIVCTWPLNRVRKNSFHDVLFMNLFLKPVASFSIKKIRTIKKLPSKHSSWWRRLKDVFRLRLQKTSSRRLDQDEYVCLSLTSSEDVFKTSSRRLGQDQYIRLGYTSSRRLQDVFKTSSRRLAKRSSRHLQDVLKNVFKTSSRRIIKLNCSC